MGLPKLAAPEYSLTLPSTGKELKYRPFLVKEEKLLLLAMESDDEKQIMSATKQVIKSCVLEELNVDELPTFDIEYIFLWLRGKAKGEVVELKYKCPDCTNEIDISFNIEDINVQFNDKHQKDIKLTDNLGVVMRYPNIALQSKMKATGDEKSEDKINNLFKTVESCIDYIYDAETTYPSKDYTAKEMQEFLDSLTDSQFQSIASFFETMPKLAHDVKLHCKNKVKSDGKEKTCGYKENRTLEGLQSFFG